MERTLLRPGDRVVVGNSTVEFRDGPAVGDALGGALVNLAAGQRLPAHFWRRLVAAASAVAIAALVTSVALHRKQARQHRAEEAFARGLAELAEDPPAPDLALADFAAAQRDMLDQRALEDAAAEARDIAGAIQRLARARELANQGSFVEARRQLQGLPAGTYFDHMSRAISEEIDARESAQLLAPRPPVPVIRALGQATARPLAINGPSTAAKRPHRTLAAPPDDDRAEQLCDDADALLGPNPEAARHKYREALKVARPGSAAARRAQGGLAN